uniref:BTB domain-containing protein n=1 Tax=Panagrolaimus sp. ES5 TaxID=591445 RepID=A0AC34FWE8_9BILA
MDFRPFDFDEVLTISKEELEDVALKKERKIFSIECKEIKGVSNAEYYMELVYNDESKKEDDPESDLFTAYLSFAIYDSKILRGKFGFYIKSAEFLIKNDSDFLFFGEDDALWEKTVFSLTDVLNPEKRFIQDGKLTLHIKGIVFIEPSDIEKTKSVTSLAQYLWERDDRDFVISVVKNPVRKNPFRKTEIKIHKCVFASRSPVFDAMLQAEMKEKAEGRVEIVDFDVEVVQAAVEYFYDRDTYKSLNLDKLISLLQFAEKYDIKDLKADVEYAFLAHLSPATICQIANASIQSNSLVLKDLCVQTMIIYINQKTPFADSEILDKDFASKIINAVSSVDNF